MLSHLLLNLLILLRSEGAFCESDLCRLLTPGSHPLDIRLRSEGDSNPRNAFDVYTLSRRASSTTRAPLRLIAIASVFLSNLLPKMDEITAFSAKAMRS